MRSQWLWLGAVAANELWHSEPLQCRVLGNCEDQTADAKAGVCATGQNPDSSPHPRSEGWRGALADVFESTPVQCGVLGRCNGVTDVGWSVAHDAAPMLAAAAGVWLPCQGGFSLPPFPPSDRPRPVRVPGGHTVQIPKGGTQISGCLGGTGGASLKAKPPLHVTHHPDVRPPLKADLRSVTHIGDPAGPTATVDVGLPVGPKIPIKKHLPPRHPMVIAVQLVRTCWDLLRAYRP